MKRAILLVLLTLGCLAFSQSDEVLDRLYMDDNAKTLETALIVLQAANILTEESEVDDAEAFLLQEDWGARVLEDGDYISTGSFSLLVMKSFELKSGLMYKLIPSRRYALKELLFQGYILGNPYPNDTMSSFNVIYTVSSLPTNENINVNYVYEDEVIEDEVTEDEVIEDEVIEDEVIEDEVIEDEVIEDEVIEDEVIEDNSADIEAVTEDDVTDGEELITEPVDTEAEAP